MSDKKKIAEMQRRKETLENKIAAIREARAFRGGIATLIESELEKAEVALAAKAVVEKIGKMAEDIATIEGEDIVPMLDSLKLTYGPAIADEFHKTSTEKLRAATEALIAVKDALSQQVAKMEGVVNGEAPNDMAHDEAPAEMPPAENDMANASLGDEDDHEMGDADMNFDAEDDMGAEAPVPGGDDLDDLFGDETDDSAAGRPRKESAAPKGKRLSEKKAGKKPDADKDGKPDWADKNPFKKGGDEDRKEENLSESKNPDLTVVNAFRKAVKEGMAPVKAARKVAETFAIDFTDVVEIVKEFAPSRKVKEAQAAKPAARFRKGA